MTLHPRMARRWLLAVSLGVTIAACASSSEPRYFVLSPSAGPRQVATLRMIKLGRPGLAGYLDRAELVSRVVDHRVLVESGDRWGEPLGDMIGRVLAEDLSARLPESRVFTEAGAISVDPDIAIELDVMRFEVESRGTLVLHAQVALVRGRDHGATSSEGVELTEHPSGPGSAALVDAMSQALGHLADRIALLTHID